MYTDLFLAIKSIKWFFIYVSFLYMKLPMISFNSNLDWKQKKEFFKTETVVAIFLDFMHTKKE